MVIIGEPIAVRIHGAENKELFRVGIDGRVTMCADLNLEDLRALPIYYLHFLREIINTAIYDIENPQ